MMMRASWSRPRWRSARIFADPESLELVEPGEVPLDDPAGLARAGAMGNALAGAVFGVMPRARRRRRYLS